MPGLSNAVENKLLNALCVLTAYTVSSNVIALTAVAVTEADTAATITKAAYGGYADRALNNAVDMAPASGGAKVNQAVIAFPTNVGATSPTVVGFAVLAGGDVVLYGSIVSVDVDPGIAPQFDIGTLTLSGD
jgi:hypothetical protein